MKCRSKNDINFFKAMELTSRIIYPEDATHILEETYLVFKPKNIHKFSEALKHNGKLKRRFVMDIDFDKPGGAGRFIDADTFLSAGDLLGVFKTILKPKRRFYGHYNVERDLSLREGEYLLNEFKAYLSEVKKLYDYIYNPPARLSDASAENTQGSFERQAFAETYGGYMEMTYLLTGGHALEEDAVWNWGVNRFLFRGEYALRKRDVENLK